MFLVPSLLLAAAYRLQQLAPRWIGRLLITVALAMFASYAASQLTFHFVQQWVNEFSIEQHRSIAIFTSVVNYAASIALAVILIGLAYTVNR